jgi:hypothetical protein
VNRDSWIFYMLSKSNHGRHIKTAVPLMKRECENQSTVGNDSGEWMSGYRFSTLVKDDGTEQDGFLFQQLIIRTSPESTSIYRDDDNNLIPRPP